MKTKLILSIVLVIAVNLMIGCSGMTSASSNGKPTPSPTPDVFELLKDCKNFGTIKSCQDYLAATKYTDEKLNTMREVDIRLATENRKQASMRLEQSLRERNATIAEYKGQTPTPTATPSNTKR